MRTRDGGIGIFSLEPSLRSSNILSIHVLFQLEKILGDVDVVLVGI